MFVYCWFSGQYYRREEVSYRNRPSSRTDSDYHRRYSPVSLLDYSAQIEMLDPQESMMFRIIYFQNYSIILFIAYIFICFIREKFPFKI